MVAACAETDTARASAATIGSIHLGIIGISLSHAPPQLGLTPVWMGLLGGASLFGLFAGALFTGPVADRYGRRPIFAYNMGVLGALSLLQGLIALVEQGSRSPE